jgi:hypothetical protein
MLEIDNLYEILVVVVGLVVAFFLITRHAIRLLARTVYRRRRWRRVRALIKVFRFLTFGIGRKAIYLAACRWIEAELLNPRPPRPNRFDSGPRRDHRAAVREFRAAKRDWMKEAWQRLADLMSVSKQSHRLLQVATCFDLYRAEEEIQHYFDMRVAGEATIDTEPETFQSHIQVLDGFLAPLSLLAGLLAHFDENWRPVIESYGNALRRDDDPLTDEVRALQSFLFNCWLLWGPSVPIGTCDRWKGGKVLLQFGYGDENNSIAVLRHGVPASPYPFPRKEGDTTLATHVEVIGMLKRHNGKNLCQAQQPQYLAGNGQLVLQAAQDIERQPTTSAYYSAYIWVLFVICDSEGRPLAPPEEFRPDRTRKPPSTWRNMLTFFEHGNIAEEYTYTVLKQQLANKARSSVELILAADPTITVRYGCAIDDCGCGHPTAWPPPQGESIREMLTRYRPGGGFAGFAASGRVILEPLNNKDKSHIPYSACRLPEMVRNFTTTLEEEHPTRQGDVVAVVGE